MSSPGRWTLALGTLITASALATVGCCTVKWCDPAERIVIVKEQDTRSGPYVRITISKSKHQQIAWKLASGSAFTNVAIQLGSNPEPFVACETSGGICHIPCEHGVCLSGSINPALHPPLDYEYAFAGPSAASTDPGIRIDP
jgi:hypothetical protein